MTDERTDTTTDPRTSRDAPITDAAIISRVKRTGCNVFNAYCDIKSERHGSDDWMRHSCISRGGNLQNGPSDERVERLEQALAFPDTFYVTPRGRYAEKD